MTKGKKEKERREGGRRVGGKEGRREGHLDPTGSAQCDGGKGSLSCPTELGSGAELLCPRSVCSAHTMSIYPLPFQLL